jgi:hypothetical protein
MWNLENTKRTHFDLEHFNIFCFALCRQPKPQQAESEHEKLNCSNV